MRFISISTYNPTNRLPTEAEMASMHKLIVEGMKAGWLIECEGVTFGTTGVRVHKAASGEVTVTDGPFAETKEVLGGYALLNAASKEEAVEHTRRFLDHVGQKPARNLGGNLGNLPAFRDADGRRKVVFRNQIFRGSSVASAEFRLNWLFSTCRHRNDPQLADADDKKFNSRLVAPISASLKALRRSCRRAFSLRGRVLGRRGSGHRAGW